MRVAIVYYTDGRLPFGIDQVCWSNLHNVKGDCIVKSIMQSNRNSLSLKQMVINIMAGIAQTDAEYIYLAEHDVLYPHGYFTEPLTDCDFFYTSNGYYLNKNGYSKRHGMPLSSMCGQREAWQFFFDNQLKTIYTHGKYKHGEPSPSDYRIKRRVCPNPYIDIRHGGNYTGERASGNLIDKVEYWGNYKQLWRELGCTA